MPPNFSRAFKYYNHLKERSPDVLRDEGQKQLVVGLRHKQSRHIDYLLHKN